MSVMLAMDVTTTADDRGYLQWLAQNWMVLAVPIMVFTSLLIAWAARRIHAGTAEPPGSGDQLGTQLQSMEAAVEPNAPPSGTSPESEIHWHFGPQVNLVA
jgi:hypothetical protein